MPAEQRPAKKRYKALQLDGPSPRIPLATARAMYAGLGGKEFHCTIVGHYRTRIFEFPGIIFRPTRDEPHHMIYSSPSVQACVASNLLGYFEASSENSHFALSPSLRHFVGEAEEEAKSQQKDRTPVFVVIEEFNQLTPVEMVKGECVICEEVAVRNGERIPRLAGGREGRRFVVAFHTVDGAWPEPPNNQRLVNLVLAGVRAGQQTTGSIRKHVDTECFVTDDNRLVAMMRMEMSAEATAAREMDVAAYRGKMSEIREAIAAMEQDMSDHLAQLVDSMYNEERKGDAYQRLQYLQLHQSLVEGWRKVFRYQGTIKRDKSIVAGNSSLRQLNSYRNDLAHWRTSSAHWRTGSIDGNLLADLGRTINELLRRRYFD